MKLVYPTDFEILEALSDEYRNTAQNISVLIGKNREYINTRLPYLADYELVERVGPAERSGLYVITDKGLVVLEHQEKYKQEDIRFEELLASDTE